MKGIAFLKSPYTSFAMNALYAAGNCLLGFSTKSWWFITLGAYHVVLAINRFSVLQIKRKAAGNYDTELFARRVTGYLFIVLSFCIAGLNVLCAVKDRGNAFHEIVMITIATYTFTKITIAVIGVIKAKHSPSPVLKTLRNISLADATASIYSMQRSMLISFPGMEPSEILLMNILTGTAVWFVVMILGINLIGGKYTDMAKSKLIKANEKIAETVTGGYRKIAIGVVDGYKKIEHCVTEGYRKIEDKFVDAYLTKDGETVEEAKARLKTRNDNR